MTEIAKKIVFSGHQPNFLPYMGFFYKMYRSDIFVLDDDVQYSNKGLHNANYIKVNNSKHKMTIPVRFSYGDRINEVRIFFGSGWDDKLLKTLKMNYGKCPHFNDGYELVKRELLKHYERLVDLNVALIKKIAEKFGIGCKIVVASKDVPTTLSNNERNVYQCVQLGGNIYFSGTGGRVYNDEKMYKDHGIELIYSDYEPISYAQKGTGFIQNLSVIDYIFNEGFEIPKEWEH